MSLRTTPPTIQATSFALRRPEEHILPGGIPLYIIEAPGTGALRLDVVFPAGKQHEIHPLQSYYASQMLRYGCQGYTAAEFAERIDYYGAGLRSSVFMNRTCISLVTLKKHFASTVELMRRMLATPAYDEERLRIRCDADKAQLRVNLQKGSFVAMRTLRQSIYGNQHPCGTLVTPDDYDTLTSQHLRDYYDRYLSKGPCRLYLSGDVDDDTLAVLQSQLSTDNSQRSTVNGQQSTVNSRQSTVNGQQSMVNGRQSTVNGQRSTVNGQQSTVNCELSIALPPRCRARFYPYRLPHDGHRSSRLCPDARAGHRAGWILRQPTHAECARGEGLHLRYRGPLRDRHPADPLLHLL